MMNNIVIFDFETTGLIPPEDTPLKDKPRIIEFAGIKLNSDLHEIDRLNFLVDPGIEISKFITNLTGISNDMVSGKGSFAKHLKSLQIFFIGAREGVAHNFMFDHDILKIELERLGKVTQFPWPPFRTCTVEKTMHLKGHRLKLPDLHQWCFSKAFEGAHRAMTDVEALTRCYILLKEKGEIQA